MRFVMAGLDPAIHVFLAGADKDVDAPGMTISKAAHS